MKQLVKMKTNQDYYDKLKIGFEIENILILY